MAKLLAVIVSLAVLGLSSNANPRVIGGHAAKKGQFPHQVSLQVDDGNHICGGSIVAPNKILTAAHCIYGNEEKITVVAGINALSEKGAEYSIASSVIIDGYNPKTNVNDIAVLTLENAISYNDLVRPVKLANRTLISGEKVTVSGWGVTKLGGAIPDELQCIDLKFVDLNTCAIEMIGQPPITYGHICTKTTWGEGVCHGDSGSPLIDANGEQVGIVSWGVPCAMNKPDIYTSIKYFSDWIQKQM